MRGNFAMRCKNCGAGLLPRCNGTAAAVQRYSCRGAVMRLAATFPEPRFSRDNRARPRALYKINLPVRIHQ